MPPPIIGITCGTKSIAKDETVWALPTPYVQMISTAGGVPLVIAPVMNPKQLHAVFNQLDGLLFSGGGDIHPRAYKASVEADLREVDEERDHAELFLIQQAVERGKPFLAICRGIQLLNVALGGSLYQDLTTQLPTALVHDAQPQSTDRVFHRVLLSPDTHLHQWIGRDEIETNSSHHQAIKRLARGLRIGGRAADGVIEAVELLEHPFGLGVQWHPERLPARAESGIIFTTFVRAATA